MSTSIERVYGVIHNGIEQVYNVYYKSGKIVHVYCRKGIPRTVSDFIRRSYVYFVLPDVKLYKLENDSVYL